jgi:hypothetical protein
MAEKEIEKLSGSGITIDGEKTLEEFLDEEEAKALSEGVELESREVRRSLYRGKGIRWESEKGRSGRTRFFTDREIRKEYGIMAKPFQTTVENIIWAIFHKQPITVKQIAKEINWEKSISSLSAQMKGIWDRLGVEAQIIDRKPVKGGPGFTYFVRDGVDMTDEAAIQKYKATPDPRSKKSKKNNRIKEMLEISEEVSPIEKVISETISNKLGVKVEVTGHVEVVFRFIVGRD